MNALGSKLARKRKDLGMTQIEFAEKLSVTRQTVSRWEAGTVLPDIDKIGDIAALLGVSCDYLLRDEISEDSGPSTGGGVSRLLLAAQGRAVKLRFFEGEEDPDLLNRACTVLGFEGSWMRLSFENKKELTEKLIPVSSILSLEFVGEG